MSYGYNQKVQNEYIFQSQNEMASFVNRLSRNAGVVSMDMKAKDKLSVTFRDETTKAATDNLYNESYQPVEEKVDTGWWDRETRRYDAKYGPGKAGDDTQAMKDRRKKRLDKMAADEREVKAKKQREIERGREAESKRKGEEAKKKRREDEKNRQKQADQLKGKSSQKKPVSDGFSPGWPDITAALEEVQKKNLSEASELSEMDPKEHVKKDEKTGMYCVYDKDGKKVKEFKSQEDANKYATDNHDSLMEYGKPGKPRLANQPLVKTGQGDYEKNIRPSDLLKKMRKKKKR